jgi:hypothetical protein
VNAATSIDALYEASVRYLIEKGWRREELGSGWWWREGMNEGLLADALDQQFQADGVDFRRMLPGEPEEFWG